MGGVGQQSPCLRYSVRIQEAAEVFKPQLLIDEAADVALGCSHRSHELRKGEGGVEVDTIAINQFLQTGEQAGVGSRAVRVFKVL
jgi:hypothetical protein